MAIGMPALRENSVIALAPNPLQETDERVTRWREGNVQRLRALSHRPFLYQPGLHSPSLNDTNNNDT